MHLIVSSYYLDSVEHLYSLGIANSFIFVLSRVVIFMLCHSQHFLIRLGLAPYSMS